jgi:hypothetical protein
VGAGEAGEDLRQEAVGIFVDAGVEIDVSGAVARKSVADLFVPVELRGDEFANNPVQRNAALRGKIMSAIEAANLIPSGVNVGMSGFTGAGYPKEVPTALAKRIMDANLHGQKFKIGVWTGASTAPELDGALARVGGIEMRLPYQSDPVCRDRINAGQADQVVQEALRTVGQQAADKKAVKKAAKASRKASSKKASLASRCQFHQHFMQSFFISPAFVVLWYT